ncbi:GGDEF domain-containing protein [Streptomyces buecherae]|uniref:GGDEF domain-containing protein n=2 Tax=Streptomyces TaxID=1883 RepID=UPI001C272E80|nr:GGDEF domain-containing protein [Streptomyces buecherae]
MSHLVTATAAVAPLLTGWSATTWWLHRRLHQARLDPLSGLPTRAHFEKGVERLLRRRVPVTLVVIDLDGFKALNDTHGHLAGDAAITSIGSRLSRWAAAHAERWVVARLGGDEFAAALTMPHATDLPGALGTLHENLCAAVPFEGRTVVLGASVGAVWSPHWPLADRSRLLRGADEAMYAVKRTGGGWRIAHSDHTAVASVNGRRRGRPGTHPMGDAR